MEITLEEIQRKFDGLPEDLKWAIMAAKVDENILEIGKMQNLNVGQMGQLSLETHMVMFGFTPPDKFEESVKNSMRLGDEKTRLVVNAVNEKILKEIRTKMLGNPSSTSATQKIVETPKKIEEIGRPARASSSLGGNDTKILNSAGIQIIPEPANNVLINEGSDKKLKEDIHSILGQKLSTSVQNPIVRTEHTLDNITKSPNTSPVAPQAPTPPIPPSSIMGTIKPASPDTSKLSPSYQRGADPYRMKPE